MSPATDTASSRSYWTSNVDTFPGPVAQFRMSQLIDYDHRLTDPARTVYRFLIGWYMHTHGDALASVRHIVATMRARAPDGARHLSRSAVSRAIILLTEKGWLVRTHTGNRSGASRFVPVLNVLDLATQGTLPAESGYVPLHRDTNIETVMSHSTGTQVSHSTGTQNPDASHFTGTKTLIQDSGTDPRTGISNEVSADPALAGLAAATPASGFERAWIAYGRLGNKRASREAWAALVDPTVELIVERAASWAASARAGQKRMPFEKWLAAEKFDEADRQVVPKGPKAKAKPVDPPQADNDDDALDQWPVGTFVGQFIDGRVDEALGDMSAILNFRIDAPGIHYGRLVECRYFLKTCVTWLEKKGHADIAAISRAVGMSNVTDTDMLLGKPIIAISDGATVIYRSLLEQEAA